MTEIFVITSVINTGDVRWSYTPTRSIFTPEERFLQTIESIESIRRYCPGAKILLVEASRLENSQTTAFEELCDYVLNVYDLEKTKEYCLNSSKKGLGDAWLFLQGLTYIVQNGFNARVIIKLSGRYRITNTFNREQLSNELPTFRQVSADSYITFCFSIPGSLCKTGIEIMEGVVNMYCTPANPSIESYLPFQFSHVKSLTHIGAEGQIAVDHTLRIYSV